MMGDVVLGAMEMGVMFQQPWNYWSKATCETVRLELAKLAAEVEMDASEMSWADYPVTRQRYEDVVRALRDLIDVIQGEGHEEPVGMGEEAAP